MTARRHLDNNSVGPEKLSASMRAHRYCFEGFSIEPYFWQKGLTGAGPVAAGGTDATENVVFTGRHLFEYRIIGTASDRWGPFLATDGGYDWKMDGDTLAEGVEINFGGLTLGHPRNYKPSVENFFARILLITEDASGTDIVFGTRLVAPYQAALTGIVDIAGIEILGDDSSTTGAFSVVSNLGNSGSTDYVSTAIAATPLEDATAVELEVQGVGNKVQFFVNGKRWGQDVNPSFTAASKVSPILRILQTTDISTQIKTLCFECGLLEDRYPDSLLNLTSVVA
jgi:hypothetical protein